MSAVLAWGITFDLTISAPLLYWWFRVRSGKARVLTVAPVFIAGTLLATMLLPKSEQQFVHQLRTFVVPLAELALIAALVNRVRRAQFDGDVHARIGAAARAFVGDHRVAEVVASEVAMLYYALFCWRRKPEANANAFTVHERNGWSTILACIFVLLAAEGIGMHLLLGLWSPAASWIWTAMDLWAALWLLGDFHALRLRRSSVDADALQLRYGMRWNVTVPLANIESIEPVRNESEWKRRDVLKVAMLDEPRWLITLREPLIAHGLAGMQKEIRAIALLADDDQPLLGLRSRTSIN